MLCIIGISSRVCTKIFPNYDLIIAYLPVGFQKNVFAIIMKGVVMMGTAIVLILLGIALILIIRSMIADKKKGKSLSCGGDCRNCRGCH